MNDPEQITYFAETDARNRKITFGIKAKDRTKHVYVIGKTGMGKSTLLENMAAQDITNGNGMCFIDPHGNAVDTIMKYIPKERIEDVIYFAPFDMDNPISFNVMEDVGYDKRHLVVSGLMSTFKKIWQDAWSARMEYILGNTLLALLEYPNATLLEVNRMLSDKEFRNKVVDNVTDLSVKSFWVDEFAKYTDRFAAEATPAIQNKIGQFTANPLIRNIIGQPNSSFDLRKVIDERKILVVNLSKGRIGESNANLLGSMLITKLYLAAMSRADSTNIEELPNFYLYVDEFQSFANESFADILSEARKYKLNLTIAHQYIEQMSEEVRAAVFGNVGTLISFRVGSYDAEVLEKEFAPYFLGEDIVNLGAFQIYLKLMIDGIGSQPFSAKTIPPVAKTQEDHTQEIIKSSRKLYASPREKVEEIIKFLHREKPKTQSSDQHKDEGKGRDDRGRSDGKRDDKNHKKKEKPVISREENKRLQEQIIGVKSDKDTALKRELFEKESREKDRRENLSEDEESLEEISLKDLKSNTKKLSNKKGGSEENKNSLKNALFGILGELQNELNGEFKKDDLVEANKKPERKSDEKPDFKQNIQTDDKKIDDDKLKKSDFEPNKPKSEITEDELKSILGIEE